MQTSQNGKLAFTVTWRARDGEADACANIIARFLPEARKEPGVELVTVNRSVSDPAKFLFSRNAKECSTCLCNRPSPKPPPASGRGNPSQRLRCCLLLHRADTTNVRFWG
jgi:hypothetical protein